MDVNLVLLKENGSRKVFPLPSSVTVIGRRHDCDLCIPHVSVSRRHCQLNRNGGILKIRDLGSRNGTILNGKRVDEAVVQRGDYIEVGPLKFVLQIDGQPKDIAPSSAVARELPRQDTAAEDAPTEGTTDDQFADFAEIDDTDNLDSLLDDFNPSEGGN
jgi:pSer/pThr/pTyr-binding forkhead associated (FHA) protein